MKTPTREQASFRRRLLVWTPLAVVLSVLWTVTSPLGNGISVLSFGLLVLVAVAIVLDDGESRAEA
ncbi:hypothetical protein JTF08_13565 [Micrococcaceae bacterium RIT802]|nr:hypothetical protein [Micrococcaceae bacterium RIT 802]